MSVEKRLTKYEQEIAALKTSFQQSAAEMPMYSTEVVFSTSMNSVSFTHPAVNPLEWEALFSMPSIDSNTSCGDEPVVVTFTCLKGINTFANLEIEVIEGGGGLFGVSTRRILFDGGARWLVNVQPNVELKPNGWYDWSPTKLKFVVKSAAEGTLGAKMIWQ